jgi:DNA-binding response OmpR family regulator
MTEIKVIIITNLESEDHKRRAAELGAARYLVKAFLDPHDLVKHVDTIIER